MPDAATRRRRRGNVAGGAMIGELFPRSQASSFPSSAWERTRRQAPPGNAWKVQSAHSLAVATSNNRKWRCVLGRRLKEIDVDVQ